MYLYLPDSPHYEVDLGRFATHAGQISQNYSLLFPKEGPKLAGVIEEARHIYDDKMPPNASLYQIDQAVIGSKVTCLVRDVDEHKKHRTEVSLTLLNSRLAGSKQVSLDGT